MSVANVAINITELVGRVAAFGESALPVARFIASWLPGGGPVLAAINVALPIIQKITAAAPVVAKAIEAGRPIIEAIETSGPAMLPHIKELLAIAINHDPERTETTMTAEEVPDAEAAVFAKTIFHDSYFTPQDPRFERASGISA